MANVKITELTADTNPASTDVLPIVDVSADATKKVTIADLLENAGDGSEGSPAFSFDSDPDTGMLRSAANSLGFATGGTERLKIDDSGRLLIGSSVAGNADADNINVAGAGNVGITFRGSSSGTGNIFFADSTTGDDLKRGQIVYDHSGNSMRLHTNAVERMRIDSSGNVGIGTSSPTEKLSVDGKLHITNDIVLAQTNGRLDYDNNNSSGALRFHSTSGSAERMRITSAGKLGIGTSSPGEKLTLGGEANPTVRIHTSQQDDSWSSSSEFGKLQFYSNDFEYNGGGEMASISVGVANNFGTSPSIRFKTSTSRADGATPTERMRITGAGNVLLGGTTSPASATKALTIFNGTAPTGSVADGVVLYAEDVSSSSELKVRDEAGNVTTLSPHNFNLIPEGPSEDMAWSYYSEKDGKRINVDMLKAVRLLEQLTGEQLVFTG